MSFLKPLKTFWVVGASYFTVISSVMYAISLSNPDQAIKADSFLLILLLSFIMALGTTVYYTLGLNKLLAAILHGVIYIGGFAAFLWIYGSALSLWEGEVMIETVAIGTLIFAVVYAISTVAVRLITRILKPQKKEPSAVTKAAAGNKNAVSKAKKTEDTPAEAPKKSKKNTKEEYKNLFS